MEVDMMAAAADALLQLMEPYRFMMLSGGVLMGLFLGIVPGIGGLAGMALLLPFTYAMDTYAAFGMLLGMSAVTGTSDTIPAVLFGVPGTASAQATVMDGNPMAKKGEAGRALAAAYTSSMIGGLVGVALLALTIPFLRPVMTHIASPEMLGFSLLGISMVAILSGSAPIRGIIAAGLGIMLSMIGADSQTGTLRWTMGTIYLWEGLPIVPMVLGLFAVPELMDLAIKRNSISSESKYDVRTGMLTGFKDALKNWWLVFRCGAIGAGIGAIPGIGSSVVDWIAYGYASQTVKGASKTFGTGDVRGVIAPESANNSITAGALVPTVAFGVPGSASMALLLSVFLIHGLVPGPQMLTTNLSLTYSMVWSIAIANILGAGICFMFSGQLAKIALLRYSVIVPAVITVVVVGSFSVSRSWGDLYTLVIFTVLGWTMKRLRWARPPLILGFVLGALIERYLFISFNRYGWEWVTRPIVIVLFAVTLLLIVRPIYQNYKVHGGLRGLARNARRPVFRLSDLFYAFVMIVTAYMVIEAINWPRGARTGPLIIGISILVLGAISLANLVFTRATVEARAAAGEKMPESHMDMAATDSDLDRRTILVRAAMFMAFLLGFLALVAVIGLLPAIPVYVTAYMWFEGRENWKQILGQSVVLIGFMYLVFDRLLAIPWPRPLIGQWIPALTVIPSI